MWDGGQHNGKTPEQGPHEKFKRAGPAEMRRRLQGTHAQFYGPGRKKWGARNFPAPKCPKKTPPAGERSP
ncbi:unnamed protein product [Staurois parvus]|uniref:Uncharacterized protein n=1 Tax=Staurois parvus TaxID=386267 RepID=A0ABN9EXT9_9NEOB|nr:unnamed protein product [Staurois parvus]